MAKKRTTAPRRLRVVRPAAPTPAPAPVSNDALTRLYGQVASYYHFETRQVLERLADTVAHIEASLGAAGAPDMTVREVCKELLAAIDAERSALEPFDVDPSWHQDKEEA
jgi:hypothetical protein